MKSIFESIKKHVSQMEGSPVINFQDLKRSTIPEKTRGVYLIRNSKTHRVLYVGRTIDMSRRLYTNHLQGNQSTARLKKYLVEDPKMRGIKDFKDAKEWIKKNCYFQYLEEEDYEKRGKLEGLFGFYFDVKYIEKEH